MRIVPGSEAKQIKATQLLIDQIEVLKSNFKSILAYLQIKHVEIWCRRWYSDERHCRVFNVQDLFIQRLYKIVINMYARVNG